MKENYKLSENLNKKYNIKILEENEIELIIDEKLTLNDLFKDLNDENINIKSFRNKTNRLEALFMKIIKK